MSKMICDLLYQTIITAETHMYMSLTILVNNFRHIGQDRLKAQKDEK